MGTISDKLMRIINTKEDIRQALISKGYDVPTSIPFKEYAKMISDLPCRVDSFPDIEGIVARYSALGLTNEQMAANPVWVDKTGNGHDIQLKNFSWKGMSGVGGYEMNFNLWRNNVSSIPDISMSTTTTSVSVSVGNSTYNNNLIYIHISNWDINKNHWLKVTSTYEDGDLAFIFYNDSNTKKIGLPANGYVNILAYPEFKGSYMYISTISNKQGSFTIEQLPLYPGALVFDGVDDYGVCDNFPILTKEKGYTVVALRQWDQDFLNTTLTGGLLSTRNYSTGEGVAFEKIESSSKGYWNLGAGGIIDFAKSPFTWQTSKQYNNVGILKGGKNHGKPLCVGCGLSGGQQCGRFAIWELVILDHDATEEELTKIKNYFVKTYPWLFPDQAWTVVGKTNEDEDRATIANITGNGNDLVLSNVAFSENSGYGSYPFGMNVWNPDYIADQPYGTVHYPNDSKSYATTVKNNATNFRIKFRLRGLPEGGSFLIRVFDMNDLNTVLKTYTYTENGIHDIPSNCGIIKASSLFLYNSIDSVTIYINNGGRPIKIQSKSINAICSDGRIYLNDWTEISKPGVQTELSSKANLNITSYGTTFTKMAFKNLAIYDGKILSKDECVKAYNYLQTLKAK